MATHSGFSSAMRAAACAFVLAFSGPTFARAGDSIQFDIASQPLSAALKRFATQARMQILYRQDAVEGATANAVVGNYDKRNALQQLLRGTGLEVVFSADNAATIRAKSDGSANRERDVEGEVMRLAQAEPSRPEMRTAGAARNETASPADSSASPVNKEQDTVIVTGSRIERSMSQGSQPVNVIDRDAIERSGAGSIAQVLNNLPEVSIQASGSPYQAGRGTATVQLRGLPGGSTLVLINGRSLASTPFQASSGITNLNLLPLAAVDRIEVLPSGSSAIYGGEALAGIVNIVLKKNFNGLEVTGRYGAADGYARHSGSMGWGWSSDRASLSFIGSYDQGNELLGIERDITSTNDFRRFGGIDRSVTYSRPGNVFSLDGQNLPGLAATSAGIPAGTDGVGLAIADFTATAGVLNRNYQYGVMGAQIPASRQYSGSVYGAFDTGAGVELFTELMYSFWNSEEKDYGFDVTGQFGSVVIPAQNPFNPFGVDVGINYTFEGAGRWCYCLQQEYYRPLVGARGHFAAGWSWEVAATATRAQDISDEGPFVSTAALNAALADTNPATSLNLFADRTWTRDEIAQYISYTQYTVNRPLTELNSTLYSVDGFIKGPLFEWAAGRAEAAFGAEYNRNKLDYNYYLTFFDGARESYALFSEVRVPLVGKRRGEGAERVVMTGAVRFDDYSDFGSRTSPQVGIEFRPADSLLLRAAYGSSYKPPTLYNLNQPTTTYTNYTLADPRRGGQIYPFTWLYGGNPGLQPLTGESTSVGMVFSKPSWANFELQVTHWTNKIEQYASLLGYQAMLDNEPLFGDYIVRAEPTAEDIADGLPGRVLQVVTGPINFGTFDLAGVDIGLSWRLRTAAGEFVPTVAATNAYKYDAALVPGTPAADRVSKANTGGFAPEWKGLVGLAWNTALLETSVSARYTGTYQDYAPSTRKLGDFWLVDLNLRYDVGRALTPGSRALAGTYASLGAVNVLNALPEYANLSSGYDPRQYDLRGRFVYAEIGFKF